MINVMISRSMSQGSKILPMTSVLLSIYMCILYIHMNKYNRIVVGSNNNNDNSNTHEAGPRVVRGSKTGMT